jgi:excisionase family DNA binding protein
METIETSLEKFAETYRIRIRKDECGEPVIFGRLWKNQPIPKFGPHRPASEYHYGHQIFDNGDGRLAVLLMFESPAKWTFAERKLVAAGFTVKQSGISKGIPPFFDRHGEDVVLFDPTNKKQAKLALRISGARIKRVLTPEQKNVLATRLAEARLKPVAVPMSGYSTAEAAKKLGVTKRTLLEWIYRGVLKGPKQFRVMGTLWRIWNDSDLRRARKVKSTMKRGPKPKKRK